MGAPHHLLGLSDLDLEDKLRALGGNGEVENPQDSVRGVIRWVVGL